jgi:DNA replication licensing factor MCM3
MKDSSGKIVEMEAQMEEFLRKTDFRDNFRSYLKNRKRFSIDIDEVRSTFPELAKFMIKQPIDAIQAFEEKANKMIDDIDSGIVNDKLRNANQSTFPIKTERLKLAFDGNLGRNFVTPRGLKSSMINSLVKVQGIVTRMSIVKPKLTKSYHYTQATKQGWVQNYKDQYCIEGQGDYASKKFPTTDATGNPMTADFGFCNYSNVQKMIIQEMPERAPTGQIPRSVAVFLQDDLVDKIKPGDRVELTGVFKCMASLTSQTSGVMKSVIIATGVSTIANQADRIKYTNEDIQNIKKMAERNDLFEVLSSSIAPTVHGHKNIKKSVLLQLLGGCEKNLNNGTHLRGDINILLIGDPSTAKSQMLRHALNLAPISVNTTGRGSSGVGLTAAVTIDKETGERHLEAGAMVLADKGLICIDEFDKMDDGDRVSIHEVMEQQTVTIAKAGIHASLNARCSVIAAANPIYGDYDRTIPAARNIGLPDTLLSRFDLLFVVLDHRDSAIDKKIAERVIRNHSYKDSSNPITFNMFQDEYFIEPDIIEDGELIKETQVYEKNNPILYGNIDHDIVTTAFLKKFIAYAKKAPIPTLDEDSIEFITQAYKSFRQKGQDEEFSNKKKLPVTVRTLETLIRLATAHSKMRINNGGLVTTHDLQVALKLMNFAIFDEDDDDESGNDEDELKEKDHISIEESKSAKKVTKRKKIELKSKRAQDVSEDDEEEEKIETKSKPVKKKMKIDETSEVNTLLDFSIAGGDEDVLREKRKQIYTFLSHQQAKGAYEISISDLWDLLQKDTERAASFPTKDSMMDVLNSLSETHQILLTEQNTVALI